MGQRDGLGGLPTPLVVLRIRSMHSTVVAPSSSEMAVGLFGLFASCPEFAPAAPAVLFSPL